MLGLDDACKGIAEVHEMRICIRGETRSGNSVCPQHLDALVGPEDGCETREHFLNETVVNFCIEVSTAILDHDQSVVGVTGMKKSGENNATCCDPEQDERIDIPCPKDHIEVGSGKGADPVLGNENIFLLWFHC
jgi:hypothetical protein